MKKQLDDRTAVKESRLALALCESEKRTIEEHARKRGLSMSAFIRFAVSEYIKANQ